MVSDKFIKHKISGYKQQDKDKNRECTLTVDEVKKIIRKNYNECFCCGRHTHSSVFTLNRLDNKVGHVYENCVLSCKHCNIAKKLENYQY